MMAEKRNPNMVPFDRSTGVQQGLKAATAELERVMTGTVKVQLPGPWYPQAAEAVVAAYLGAVSPEPRGGIWDKDYVDHLSDEALAAKLSPPSVASVLRLTASRLRDPEYRWSVDPAVTLERLADELEKG